MVQASYEYQQQQQEEEEGIIYAKVAGGCIKAKGDEENSRHIARVVSVYHLEELNPQENAIAQRTRRNLFKALKLYQSPEVVAKILGYIRVVDQPLFKKALDDLKIIYDMMLAGTPFKFMKVTCPCEPCKDLFAFVSNNDTRNHCINLGPRFWTAKSNEIFGNIYGREGCDTQVSTLLHEMSHFGDFCGLDDLEYDHLKANWDLSVEDAMKNALSLEQKFSDMIYWVYRNDKADFKAYFASANFEGIQLPERFR